jgi:hypothetical protein
MRRLSYVLAEKSGVRTIIIVLFGDKGGERRLLSTKLLDVSLKRIIVGNSVPTHKRRMLEWIVSKNALDVYFSPSKKSTMAAGACCGQLEG